MRTFKGYITKDRFTRADGYTIRLLENKLDPEKIIIAGGCREFHSFAEAYEHWGCSRWEAPRRGFLQKYLMHHSHNGDKVLTRALSDDIRDNVAVIPLRDYNLNMETLLFLRDAWRRHEGRIRRRREKLLRAAEAAKTAKVVPLKRRRA